MAFSLCKKWLIIFLKKKTLILKITYQIDKIILNWPQLGRTDKEKKI